MKQKLLLLHGALGSKEQLDPLKAQLEDVYEVHSLTFEGHGGVASSKDFSIALFTRNVIDFLQAHAIDQVTVFGYSMGGYVALNTALKVPEKIRKIITLGTKFDWSLEQAQKEVKMLNPDKIEEKIPHFAQRLQQLHEPLDWKTVMNKTAQMMLAMAKGAKLTDTDFANINVPVTIGRGSLDSMVSQEESEHLAEVLPTAKLITLEGVKHPIETVPIKALVSHINS